MAKTYNLFFDGYLQDKDKANLPNIPGVYCVYKGTLQLDDTVILNDIVYIGEAEDIRARHNDKEHEHYKDFVMVCGGKEHIWYSYAKVIGGETERKRVENVLIYKLQPIINDKGKDSFNYRKTTVNSSGEHHFIPNTITVGEDWRLDI